MLVDGGWKIFSITAYTAEATEKLTKRGPNHDVFPELQSLWDANHQYAQWNPINMGLYSRRSSISVSLCKRVAAIVHQYAISNSARQVETLGNQLATTAATSHRWIVDMLQNLRSANFKATVFSLLILHRNLRTPPLQAAVGRV